MNCLKSLLLAIAATLAQTPALAVVVPDTPFVRIELGDGSVRDIRSGDDGVAVSSKGDVQTWRIADFTLGDTSFSGLNFSFDPDPFIAFAVTLTKTSTGSTSFSFSFGSPFVAGPYDRVSSQLDGTLLTTRTAAQMSGITHRTAIDGATRLLTTMPDCTSGSPATDCTGVSDEQVLSPASPAGGFFSSAFDFTLSGPAQAQFLGRSDIFNASAAVPTPATLPLALLALAGLGCTLRRRGSHSAQPCPPVR